MGGSRVGGTAGGASDDSASQSRYHTRRASATPVTPTQIPPIHQRSLLLDHTITPLPFLYLYSIFLDVLYILDHFYTGIGYIPCLSCIVYSPTLYRHLPFCIFQLFLFISSNHHSYDFSFLMQHVVSPLYSEYLTIRRYHFLPFITICFQNIGDNVHPSWGES